MSGWRTMLWALPVNRVGLTWVMRPLVSILETMDWPSFNGYSMPVTGRLVRKPGACVFDKKKY
jgi:hypothetical protein